MEKISYIYDHCAYESVDDRSQSQEVFLKKSTESQNRTLIG